MALESAVDQLRNALKRLPGVGPKSAQRMAFHLLERDREGAHSIVQALSFALNSVSHCKLCNNFSETEICSICSNAKRNKTILCVVETPADLESIEHAGAFAGVYFVLMGHLAPLDNIGPENLSIEKLRTTVFDNGINEIVLATNLTLEGQATADFIASLFESSHIQVSRLARGVPVGGELEYMDPGTLYQAFEERRLLSNEG